MRDSSLPELLRGLRKTHKMTQARVAEYLGIVQQAYSHYEKGIRTPDTRTLLRLAELYKVDPAELLQNAYMEGGSPEEEKDSDRNGTLWEMVGFFSGSENRAKYKDLSPEEKELIYYYLQMKPTDRRELMEIAKIKVKLKRRK